MPEIQTTPAEISVSVVAAASSAGTVGSPTSTLSSLGSFSDPLTRQKALPVIVVSERYHDEHEAAAAAGADSGVFSFGQVVEEITVVPDGRD